MIAFCTIFEPRRRPRKNAYIKVIFLFEFVYKHFRNLMFFWQCIMNWLYINYELDALIIIYS